MYRIKRKCDGSRQRSRLLQAKKKLQKQHKMLFSELIPAKGVVPAVGLEPTRCRHQRILSPPRLPFRHTGNLL